MSAAVGADVEAICNKCGDVWHVVVAKVGARIAKVQCKECKAYHKYRASGAKRTTTKRTTRKTTRKKKTAKAAPEPEPIPVIEPDMSKPIRTYSFRETFTIGERIDHPTFGMGVVQTLPAPGKITVSFPDGRRLLAQAKPAPTLEARRVSFDD